MSILTWKEEFCNDTDLEKWIGLRPENLAKHGVTTGGSQGWRLTDDERIFRIDASTCMLCELYLPNPTDCAILLDCAITHKFTLREDNKFTLVYESPIIWNITEQDETAIRRKSKTNVLKIESKICDIEICPHIREFSTVTVAGHLLWTISKTFIDNFTGEIKDAIAHLVETVDQQLSNGRTWAEINLDAGVH